MIVCAGTYDEQVVVTKSLALSGRGATIDAKGQKPLKIGPQTLPGSIGMGVLGTSGVRVSGFRVTGASFDAILVGASRHVLVTGNYLWGNGDVGVDVNGSSYTQVACTSGSSSSSRTCDPSGRGAEAALSPSPSAW